MPEFVGRSLGRYRIVELLGAGGMGEVYRARDSTLGRDVAIKVLSDAITQNPKHLERFQREARSLAQLSHPNILAIHDFRTDEGIAYAVEELLEGRDLGRIIVTGPVPLQRAIDIVCSVAEGLGAAHRKGIIHRDVKPENIFELEDGGVKILDFGLARSFDRCDTEDSTLTERSELTSPGSVVGTTNYMSPEQARGDELGPATDVFSLGVVFYELLTGVHPFRKKSAAETTASILREDPVAPGAIVPNIPPAIEAVVGRCLEKRSDERFESARDIAFALKAVSGQVSAVSAGYAQVEEKPSQRGRWLAIAGFVVVAIVGVAAAYRFLLPPPLPDIKQITVARFEAEGDDPELKYLAAGLSEVVAAGLEIVAEDEPEIEWVESMRLARRRDPDSLERAFRDFSLTLGVVGRLDRSDNDLVLDLRIVNTSDGTVLRRTEIEDSLLNPFAFQVDSVVRLVDELGLKLADDVVETLKASATDVPPALDPYLRGTGRLSLAQSEDQMADALELLETAVERDSIFDDAKVAAARACLGLYRQTEEMDWLEKGAAHGESAIDSETPAAQAFLILASILRSSGEQSAAIDVLRRVVGTYPKHGEARRTLARAFKRAGRLDEAEREYQRAIYLQPEYWPSHHYLAEIYTARGQFHAAVTEYRRVVEIAPLYVGGYTNLGATFGFMGRFDLAREIYERSLEVDTAGNYAAYSNLAVIYERERRFADSAEMLERALEIHDSDYRVWGNLGWVRLKAEGTRAAEAPFHTALELADAELAERPSDPDLLCDMASYHAGLGEFEEGMERANSAAALEPTDPVVVASIAEVYEDLNERERALEWVERAFSVGVSPSEFEDNPTLRELVADERYQKLAAETLDGDPSFV